jgi:hypothetical protein
MVTTLPIYADLCFRIKANMSQGYGLLKVRHDPAKEHSVLWRASSFVCLLGRQSLYVTEVANKATYSRRPIPECARPWHRYVTYSACLGATKR